MAVSRRIPRLREPDGKLLRLQVSTDPIDQRTVYRFACGDQATQGEGTGIVGIFSHIWIVQSDDPLVIDAAPDECDGACHIAWMLLGNVGSHLEQGEEHKGRQCLSRTEQAMSLGMPATILCLLRPEIVACTLE